MPFRIPTRVELRPGASSDLGDLARRAELSRVLLVTDAGVAATGIPDRLTRTLEAAGVTVGRSEAVEPNPRMDTVDDLGARARDERFDAVVGVGGGSVLDAAKAAAMLATNGGSGRDYEGRNRFAKTPLPFVAVPTTCGTGSEVTWVSVLSDAADGVKRSVKGDGMFPDWALVDADLLRTLPRGLVASTGVDAVTHAIEAYVGRESNPVSDALSEAALRLHFAFLPRAVADVAGDDEARHETLRASTLAGMAFGNADVAGVHCLSEAAGGMFDVPHGLTNAILLTSVLRYQQQAAAARLAKLHDALFGEGAADPVSAMLNALDELTRRLEIPDWSALGIPADALDEIARRAEANGSNGSNPREMRAADYRAVLENLARPAAT